MMQTATRTLSRAAVAMALVVAAAFGFSLSSAGSAYGVTAAEKQAEAQEALNNLNAMQETLDILSAEYGEAVMAQEAAEEARDAAQARIVEINGELESVQKRLNERARDMYRSGTASFVEMLLGAESFEEFATSLDLLSKVNKSDADLVDAQRDLKQEAEEQEAILTEQAAIAEENSRAAEQAAADAEVMVAEMQATYDSLSAEAAELLEEERKAAEAAEQARLEAERAEAARQAAAAAAAEAANQDVPTAYLFDDEVVSAYEGGSDTVSRAYACLGAPYVWGGVGPYGYDCSGLVSYCLTGSHTRLGTTYTFMGWPQVSDPQPGDICVNWSHTGVYIGGGQMIHAATYGVGVIIGPVQSGMIVVRYAG